MKKGRGGFCTLICEQPQKNPSWIGFRKDSGDQLTLVAAMSAETKEGIASKFRF